MSFCFFFSSRRRHTRCYRDWSSDVCSSDLGFELRTVESAIGFQQHAVEIRDLIKREFMEGISAVFLHSKFPAFMPEIDDIDTLIRNEKQAADAESAVDDIALFEQSGSNSLPESASDLFTHVCRYYFLHGVFESLKDIGGISPRRSNATTVTIYNGASYLESIRDLDEARRLFKLVREQPDKQYWDRAEYHMGCIESQLGNPAAARAHFAECLRRNPRHNKARRMLNYSTLYRETEANVFEIVAPATSPKVLFV